MTTYCTTYCNQGHYLEDGRPVAHACYILPVAALAAEVAGDVRLAQNLIAAAQPLPTHRGVRPGVRR